MTSQNIKKQDLLQSSLKEQSLLASRRSRGRFATE
jgi:hypothetical protein